MARTINITDAATENTIPPLWRQAFRPFFLGAAMFSTVAIALWVATLSGYLSFMPYGGSFFWHGHEMIFGFVIAVIVGFLLTAVQTWTGLRATNSKALMGIFILWLSTRILMATNLIPIPWLVAIIDVSFLPVCAGLMAQLVVNAGNKRNVFFVPVMLLLATANAISHVGVINSEPSLVSWANNSAILLITALIAVVGGRVIPMFTANGTGTQRVSPPPMLDKYVLVSSWLLALLFITRIEQFMPKSLIAGLFTLSASLHLARAIHWRPWVTFKVPLVWSLHFAYWFVPLGYLLFAGHYFTKLASFSTALHALTAGAMGCMILAMLARVSLGHSGRPLVIPSHIGFAFAMLITGALMRIAIGLYPQLIAAGGYLLVGILWSGAFGLYCLHYFTILTRPRADGRPG